jgi:hypothetical protein
MEKNVHNIPIYPHAKFGNFWSTIMPYFSISKLSRFWINWKTNKTTWAPVDSLTDRTALGPRRPPQTAATADLPRPWFPAAISPPTDSPLRRPPSTAPVKSLSSSRPSPPLCRLVPPPSSHHVAPPPVPLLAPRRRHEHRVAVYHLPVPRAVGHRPRPPFPSGRPPTAVEQSPR